MGNQQGFSTFNLVFVIVALLSCNLVSSFILPRVSRTSDAIIIDFTGVGYAPFYQGRGYGEIADPGFMHNPNPMFYKGWSYFFGQPSFTTPAATTSSKQFAEVDEEETAKQIDLKQATATTTTPATTTTSTPVTQCGRGPATLPTSRSLISERVGGVTEAKKGSWPFMVFIFTPMRNGGCGGTLISDTKVLLAAQCLERLSLLEVSYSTVWIGLHSVDPLDARMTRRINKVVLHSKFDASTYVNDIAIVTLDSPVVFSRSVGPVCLPPASNDTDQYADQDAAVMGWGFASSLDSSNYKLQQGRVSIVSNNECKSKSFIGQYISDTNICVNSDTVFTCRLDIGGPVVVMSSQGTWTQVGINSFTDEACNSNGLKTRVSAFRAWIDQYVQN